jgi:hypothetical protein
MFASVRVVAIAGRPDLGVGIGGVDRAKITQEVGAAPGVVSVDEVGVAGVAIAHDGAGVSGQDLSGVDVGGAATAGVHRGQERGGRDVHVLQSSGRAAWGPVPAPGARAAARRGGAARR